MKNGFIYLLIILLMNSCGYQSTSSIYQREKDLTTSISVIRDDSYGDLRNHIAREMSFTNLFVYKDVKAKYNLHVTIEEDSTSKTCFMWDRDPVTDENLGVFYPTEGMREVIAKIELKDAETDEMVMEPFFLSSRSNYDFVNPTVPNTLEFQIAFEALPKPVLQYSLGQLDSEEGAKAESYKPLYEELAKKIVARLMKSKLKI